MLNGRKHERAVVEHSAEPIDADPDSSDLGELADEMNDEDLVTRRCSVGPQCGGAEHADYEDREMPALFSVAAGTPIARKA